MTCGIINAQNVLVHVNSSGSLLHASTLLQLSLKHKIILRDGTKPVRLYSVATAISKQITRISLLHKPKGPESRFGRELILYLDLAKTIRSSAFLSKLYSISLRNIY